MTLATSYTDTAGNAGPSATTSNYTVDTVRPSVSSFTMSDTALISGETSTVTLQFSEAVASFNSNDDITAPNGSISLMTSSDNITWTGTFTPTSGVQDTSNVLTLATSYTDTAGNAPSSASTTANYEVDTTAPSVSSFTVSDSTLKIGDTATVTIVFSEAVSGFNSNDDVTVENGSLSLMTSPSTTTTTVHGTIEEGDGSVTLTAPAGSTFTSYRI